MLGNRNRDEKKFLKKLKKPLDNFSQVWYNKDTKGKERRDPVLHKYIILGVECWLTEKTARAILGTLEWELDTDHPEDWETIFE